LRETRRSESFAARLLGTRSPAPHPNVNGWERGFLAQCSPLTGVTDDDPMWATVYRLERGVPGSDRSHTAALRMLHYISDEHAIQLAALTEPLGVEEITWDSNHEVLAEYWPNIRVLPALRRFEVVGYAGPAPSLADWAFVWRGRQLDEVVVPGEIRRLDDAFELAEAAGPRLFVICCGCTFELTRDAAGARSCLVVNARESLVGGSADPVLAALRGLAPTRLTSVTVKLPRERGNQYADRFRRALERQTRLTSPPIIETR
jgi:hypothetical protein